MTFHHVVAAFYCRSKCVENIRRGAIKFNLYEDEEAAAEFFR